MIAVCLSLGRFLVAARSHTKKLCVGGGGFVSGTESRSVTTTTTPPPSHHPPKRTAVCVWCVACKRWLCLVLLRRHGFLRELHFRDVQLLVFQGRFGFGVSLRFSDKVVSNKWGTKA